MSHSILAPSPPPPDLQPPPHSPSLSIQAALAVAHLKKLSFSIVLHDYILSQGMVTTAKVLMDAQIVSILCLLQIKMWLMCYTSITACI